MKFFFSVAQYVLMCAPLLAFHTSSRWLTSAKMCWRIQGVTEETASLISAKSGGKVELFRKYIIQPSALFIE